MRIPAKLQLSLIFVIAVLLQMLFIYAAVSKLADFQQFRVELGQSPLLAPFTLAVAIATPVVEILAVVLLFFQSTRRWGLYLSFALMVLFTAYVIVIMNYASYVPCSCGGILSEMGWKEHLVFNSCFTGLALVGVILGGSSGQRWIALRIGAIAAATILPTTFVLGLLAYEQSLQGAPNGFTRVLKAKLAVDPVYKDLGATSYYIAGLSDDSIYLGNHAISGEVMACPYDLSGSKKIFLDLPKDTLFAWGAARIYADYPNYFLAEGVTPRIFKFGPGGVEYAEVPTGPIHFDWLVPSDSGFVFRMYDTTVHRNILGATDTEQHVRRATDFITPQQDGVFSTDGKLLHDKSSGKYLYYYSYRNELLAFDRALRDVLRGRTIDTTSWAKIEIANVASKNEVKLSAPPVRVNKLGYADGGRLFIHSALRADNEKGKQSYYSSAIDVYSSENLRYLYSFYVPNQDKYGIRDMAVKMKAGKLVMLRENELTVYNLKFQ